MYAHTKTYMNEAQINGALQYKGKDYYYTLKSDHNMYCSSSKIQHK